MGEAKTASVMTFGSAGRDSVHRDGPIAQPEPHTDRTGARLELRTVTHSSSFFKSDRICSASSGVVRLRSISRDRLAQLIVSARRGAWNSPSCCCGAGGAPLSAGRPPRDSSSCSSERQDVARAGDHRRRQPGEPRHLDAVAAIGAAGQNLVQEDDLVLPLARRHVRVDDAGQRVGQIGQLVIVRGKERLRPRARVLREVLGDRPGDAQAVEGRRAAADLVEHDEAARGGAVAGCARSPASRP